MTKGKVSEIFVFDNLGRKSVPEASAGEIVMVAGLDGVMIGDTVVDPSEPKPMEPIAVEEPTVRRKRRRRRSGIYCLRLAET
jgi:GTP-binding protein